MTTPLQQPTAVPTAGRPRRRPAPVRVTVRRVERLADRMVRVTLTGPEMHRFAWPGAGSHLKLFLPEPGAVDLELPEPDPDGLVTFDRPLTSRTYTPRRFDPDSGELDLDFVLHGHGPASRWAELVEPGHRAAVSIPRASYQPDQDAGALVLAGDESALPAIATILAARPEGLPVTVAVEIRDGRDELPLGVDVTWLHRGDAEPGASLEAWLADLVPPAGARVWVATEAHAVRRIRALLLDRHGFAREHVVTRGYWRHDGANHPDHDYGEDDLA